MSTSSWAEAREAFDDAARWYVEMARHGGDHLDRPALGEWSVRDLVGHTSRSLLTVEAYLDAGATTVEVASPVDYFRLILESIGDPAAVAQRGRDAGVALGDDPIPAVAEIASRVRGLVDGAAADDLVATPVGGMRLGDYLPTRTFELTVHTCDLVAALGLQIQPPRTAATESVTLLGGLAAGVGQAGTLLRAATGRSALPAGFTVL